MLPEGAQSSRDAPTADPPIPMIGHVTSSYFSATLGRSIALALVRTAPPHGRSTCFAPLPGKTVKCAVTEPVFYDPRECVSMADT